MSSEYELMNEELKKIEVLVEEDNKRQAFEMIAQERLLERPYKEVLEALVGEHAIIADCSNDGTAKTLSLEELVISRETKDEEMKMLPRKVWTTKLVVEKVVVSGSLHERGAQTTTVTLYDEISELTAFSNMRYFSEAAITVNKTDIFVLKEGQLLQLPRIKELVQVIALCLTPPTRIGGNPMLLIVWADPRLEYVI